MRIRNNSKNEWLGYVCPKGVVVDIQAESTFEVDDNTGEFLLRQLGADVWLVEVKEETVEEIKTIPATVPEGSLPEGNLDEMEIEELKKLVKEKGISLRGLRTREQLISKLK